MAASAAVQRDRKARVIDSRAHLTVCAYRRATTTLSRALRQSSARARRLRLRNPSGHPTLRPGHTRSRLRRACQAVAFTYGGCRDCARLPRLLPVHSQVDRSPSTWSFSMIFGARPHLWLSADTAICGSRCAARLKARAIDRRALLPSPLCCGGRTVCGSGADLCVALVPHSHRPLRRSIRLHDWRLPGRPVHAERAAERDERAASVCARVSARATEVWGRAALGACCAPCLWR